MVIDGRTQVQWLWSPVIFEAEQLFERALRLAELPFEELPLDALSKPKPDKTQTDCVAA